MAHDHLANPTDPQSDWQRTHVERYLATDGAEGYLWDAAPPLPQPLANPVPTLLLTTRGAASGSPRRTPLIFGRDGARYVVVASKGGAPTHPYWYRNLTADPRVRVQVGGDVFDAVARTSTSAERPALWDLMSKIWPDYDRYQEATDREIPVVIIEPIAPVPGLS